MCEYQRFISNTVARNSNICKLEHVFEIHDGEKKVNITRQNGFIDTKRITTISPKYYTVFPDV